VKPGVLPPNFLWSLSPDGTAMIFYSGGQVRLVARDVASGRLRAPGVGVASRAVRGCRRLRGVTGWLAKRPMQWGWLAVIAGCAIVAVLAGLVL
jgi:hypothetical protein